MALGPYIETIQGSIGTSFASRAQPYVLTFGSVNYRGTQHNIPKFVILRFEVVGADGVTPANALANSQSVRINLNNARVNRVTGAAVPTQADTFNSTSGREFWTRPIATPAGTASLEFTGAGARQLRLKGVGYGVFDIFMTGGDPTATFQLITTGGISDPTCNPAQIRVPVWKPVHGNTTPAQLAAASSVGMLVYVRADTYDANLDVTSYAIGHATGRVISHNTVMTAGHAIVTLEPKSQSTQAALANQELYVFREILSGSFTPDYEVIPGVANHHPTFYKLDSPERTGLRNKWAKSLADDGYPDYFVVELKAAVGELASAPLHAAPAIAAGTTFYSIHHPSGRPKQISKPEAGQPCAPEKAPFNANVNGGIQTPEQFETNFILTNMDLDAGSSGAPIFDIATNEVMGIVKSIAVPYVTSTNAQATEAAEANKCFNYGPRLSMIITDMIAGDPDQYVRMAVIGDSSGSMSLAANTGLVKMALAQTAIRMFAEHLRVKAAPPAEQHNVTLLDFDTTPHPPLKPFTLFDSAATRTAFANGANSYIAGGMTTIGGALQQAAGFVSQGVPGSDAAKLPAVLLMTDGVHNTGVSIAVGEAALDPATRMHVIGFGMPGAINESEMSRLADKFGGDYLRAASALDLLKFYAIEYGQMLEDTTMFDPYAILPAAQTASAPIDFQVLTENTLTITVGWERPDTTLELQLFTPSGKQLTRFRNGVEYRVGETWAYMRIDLPFNGEKIGKWQAQVKRTGSSMRFRGHAAPAYRAAFSPDGVHLLTTSTDGDARLWNVRLGRSVRQLFRPLDWPDLNEQIPAAAAFTPDSMYGLVASYSGNSTYLMSLDTGLPVIYLLSPSGDTLRTAILNRTGDQAAGLFENLGIALWALNPEPPGLIKIDPFIVIDAPTAIAIAYAPHEDTLAILESLESPFPVISLVNTLEPEVRSDPVFSTDGYEPLHMIYTPDGQFILLGLADGRVLRIETGSFTAAEIGDQIAAVRSFAAHPDSTRLVIVYDDGSVRLWDMDSNSVLWELNETNARAVVFSPDGFLVMTTHDDNTLMLWDTETGQPFYDALQYDERYFVLSVVQAEVVMKALSPSGILYTGDALYPQVVLRTKGGARMPESAVRVEITRPTASVGELLMTSVAQEASLSNRSFSGDMIDGASTRLVDLENRLYIRHEPAYFEGGEDPYHRFDYSPIPEPLGSSVSIIPTRTESFPLFDDGLHYDGGMEPDGEFGAIIENHTRFEGAYQFRSVGVFGAGRNQTREAFWSVAVALGIDESQTGMSFTNGAVLADGRQEVSFTLIPRDRYGTHLGPGRVKDLPISPAPGNELIDAPDEPQPGAYRFRVLWSGDANTQPGIVLAQPGRNPITFSV